MPRNRQKQKSRAKENLNHGSCSSYITLIDYQTARSFIPDHPPLKKKRQLKEESQPPWYCLLSEVI